MLLYVWSVSAWAAGGLSEWFWNPRTAAFVVSFCNSAPPLKSSSKAMKTVKQGSRRWTYWKQLCRQLCVVTFLMSKAKVPHRAPLLFMTEENKFPSEPTELTFLDFKGFVGDCMQTQSMKLASPLLFIDSRTTTVTELPSDWHTEKSPIQQKHCKAEGQHPCRYRQCHTHQMDRGIIFQDVMFVFVDYFAGNFQFCFVLYWHTWVYGWSFLKHLPQCCFLQD